MQVWCEWHAFPGTMMVSCVGSVSLAGARRSVTCIAMEEGATLVNVSRDLFMSFIAAKPRTLQIYLHKVSYLLQKDTPPLSGMPTLGP